MKLQNASIIGPEIKLLQKQKTEMRKKQKLNNTQNRGSSVEKVTSKHKFIVSVFGVKRHGLENYKRKTNSKKPIGY